VNDTDVKRKQYAIVFGNPTMVGTMMVGLTDSTLCDALEIRGVMREVRTADGPRMGMGLTCMPLLMLASLDRVRVGGLPYVMVSDLSKDDAANVVKAIENCQQMLEQMRAQQAGITLASSIPANARVPR